MIFFITMNLLLSKKDISGKLQLYCRIKKRPMKRKIMIIAVGQV
jgi:hypothetical protein